jgi:hypothetical protein
MACLRLAVGHLARQWVTTRSISLGLYQGAGGAGRPSAGSAMPVSSTWGGHRNATRPGDHRHSRGAEALSFYGSGSLCVIVQVLGVAERC